MHRHEQADEHRNRGGRILDGNEVSAAMIARVRAAIDAHCAAGGRRPGLAVVLVGDDPASAIYVNAKRRDCERAGIRARDLDLPGGTSQEELLALIDELNESPDVDGILVQLPLPPQIEESAVTNRIRADKDVDGFHAFNVGRLALRQPGLRPCTPRGVMALLHYYGIANKSMHAVIVGASNIVGRPMALELLMARCTITVCHSRTKDLAGKVRGADVLVAAVGRPKFVPGDWIKPGALVVDVGINRLDDGSLCGDVDFEAARAHASWITPVPGGVGPMTVATLLENTLQAYRLRKAPA